MPKKLNADNFRLKMPTAPAAPPTAKAKRPTTAAAHAFIEGDRPKRGRPRGAVQKKGVMMYVPEQLHEDFRICAKLIEGRDMTEVLEQFMRNYVESHAKALATIRSVQAPTSRKAS